MACLIATAIINGGSESPLPCDIGTFLMGGHKVRMMDMIAV